MRVLAVDTTSANGSVALVDDEGPRVEVRVRAPDAHSRHLLPAIEFTLAAAGTAPGDLAAWAVATGPGSFTGLRVGLSTVQGLALASGRPCLGLSVLDVLARAARSPGRAVVVLQDAFRSEVFWAAYDEAGRPLTPGAVGPLADALAAAPSGAVYVGTAVAAARAAIAGRDGAAGFPEGETFLATGLGLLALERLREGSEPPGPESLRPLYLRGADIRKPAGT
jgi:tRNA threonylcarbamoyladenosine biosynthesis protein TsaB